jgi:hypothetical protein
VVIVAKRSVGREWLMFGEGKVRIRKGDETLNNAICYLDRVLLACPCKGPVQVRPSRWEMVVVDGHLIRKSHQI